MGISKLMKKWTFAVLPAALAVVLAVAPVAAPAGGEIAVPAGEALKAADAAQTDRLSMSYVYFGDSGAYTGYVDDTKGSLSDISPNYFDINEDGSLRLTMAVDRKFVTDMHESGVKVTPFLSNHWNRQKGINALANREKLSSQLVAAMEEYDLDGVNIDIENVTEKEKNDYTDFVRLVRQKTPSGKSVSVAVAANPWKLTTGWHGSYDYAKLAHYSDYLMLMAYDQHYEGGPAGPVAGYSFVADSIKEALNHIPAEKLVLGIPFYGRLWKQGSGYGGYGISNRQVEELIEKYRGNVVYDNTTRSAKATITILKNDIKPVVLGQKLDEGKYDIWYENEDSIKSKLSLVGKYNLKGAGSWSLGQEAKSTWDYYSLWLNGRYFSDIQDHWAEQQILEVMEKGWMLGMSGTEFMPDSPVTRAQAAVIFVRVLGLDTTEAGSAPSAFTDIGKHWARAEIEAARQNGIVEGMGAGKYGPDLKLTREQMALLVYRILQTGAEAGQLDGSGENSGPVYPDVTPESCPWSYEAIDSISALGIFDGYPDGGFHPKESLTRAELAALMVRLAPYLGNR